MKLHDEIYPDPTELTNIKNLVKVTEDNLKTISDTMRDETEAELKDKGYYCSHCANTRIYRSTVIVLHSKRTVRSLTMSLQLIKCR